MMYEREYNLTLAASPWVNRDTLEPSLLVDVLHRESGERIPLGHIRERLGGGCVIHALMKVKEAVEKARISVQRVAIGYGSCKYRGEVIGHYPKIEYTATLDFGMGLDFITEQDRVMLEAALMCARMLAHHVIHYEARCFSFED